MVRQTPERRPPTLRNWMPKLPRLPLPSINLGKIDYYDDSCIQGLRVEIANVPIWDNQTINPDCYGYPVYDDDDPQDHVFQPGQWGLYFQFRQKYNIKSVRTERFRWGEPHNEIAGAAFKQFSDTLQIDSVKIFNGHIFPNGNNSKEYLKEEYSQLEALGVNLANWHAAIRLSRRTTNRENILHRSGGSFIDENIYPLFVSTKNNQYVPILETPKVDIEKGVVIYSDGTTISFFSLPGDLRSHLLWATDGNTIFNGSIWDYTTEFRNKKTTYNYLLLLSDGRHPAIIDLDELDSPSIQLNWDIPGLFYRFGSRANVIGERNRQPSNFSTEFEYPEPEPGTYKAKSLLFKGFFSDDANWNKPPKKPKKPPMSCCPEHTRLLRLILLRLGEFPAIVPDNITSQKPSAIKLDSVGEYCAYIVKQMDALGGAYPIEITIEDTDLTKPGNQSKTVLFKNQAQVLAELYMLSLQNRMFADVIIHASTKGMMEAGLAKQAATVAVSVAMANAEFFGYRLDPETEDLPISFTPGKEDYSEMLQPSTVKNIIYKNNDKQTLPKMLKRIQIMADGWIAQNMIKIGNTVEDLKNALFSKINDYLKIGKEDKLDDFDLFLTKVEQGFSTEPGYTEGDRDEIVEPYGRPFANRPRVQEFGGDTTEGEEAGS